MEGGEKPREQGLLPRLLSFYLNEHTPGRQEEIEMSAYEVYRGRVIDLLSETNSSMKS